MTQEPASRFVVLVGGPLDMEVVKVYLFQTTTSIKKDKQIYTYQKCADNVWRYVQPPKGD